MTSSETQANRTLLDDGAPHAAPDARAVRLRQLIVELVAEYCDLDPTEIDPDQPIEDAGLSSRDAVALSGELEDETGIELPTTLLWESPTISALVARLGCGDAGTAAAPSSSPAHRVREAPPEPSSRQWGRLDRDPREAFRLPPGPAGFDPVAAGVGDLSSGIRTLRRGSAVTAPLHLFHSAGNVTTVYRPLVDRLPTSLTCHGHERTSLRGVTHRAAVHARAVQARQPEGPYRLVGWSFGGTLAYEVAVQLRAAGHDVELVAMIDAIRPPRGAVSDSRAFLADRLVRLVRQLERTHDTVLGIDLDGLADLDEDDQLDRLVRALRHGEVPWSEEALEHQRSSLVDMRDAEQYEPRAYDGDVVLYRAARPTETFEELDERYNQLGTDAGWERLARGLDIVLVDADHLSIVRPPHVGAIATDLSDRLEGGLVGAW